jgi:hypothetical protein
MIDQTFASSNQSSVLFVVLRALVKFLRNENRIDEAKSFERIMREHSNTRRETDSGQIAI